MLFFRIGKDPLHSLLALSIDFLANVGLSQLLQCVGLDAVGVDIADNILVESNDLDVDIVCHFLSGDAVEGNVVIGTVGAPLIHGNQNVLVFSAVRIGLGDGNHILHTLGDVLLRECELHRQFVAQSVRFFRGDFTGTEGLTEMIGNYIIFATDSAGLFYILLLRQKKLCICGPAVTLPTGYQLAMIRLFRILYIVNDVLDCGADGTTFAGKTVKLANDIDFNNVEWTPIGSAAKDHGFMGNFDGNGYSIKNLKITALTPDADQYVYGGLFGVTEGIDKDNQNYIKNLTIENVDINLNGHIVAAAIAYPYYTALENIKVMGNVSIKGGDYTSGVLAYTRRCVDAKNISIEANAGSSVIEGTQTVGGVISDIQTNGGLVANYSNFKAENLTIKGTKSVGGISGIIGAQNLDGAIVKNVTIVSDDIRRGMISGSFDGHSVITNAVVENVTGADSYIGCLYSGTASDRSSVTINGDVYTYNNGWIVNGCKIIADGVILNETGAYIISNAAGMFWFANEVNVNKNTFNGKTVTLANDIDLKNAAWTPVGQTGATTFNGVFDGQNYTISNLNVNSEAQTGEHYSSGLFGWVESHTAGHGHIKNVKIAGATIVGHHNCGALVGYITQETALVENCHVTGAAVTCTKANDDADGDKAGALIGNATVATPVKDCTAANSTVSAGRDAGQIIGAGKEANVTGCSATNVTVSANGTSTGANVRNEVIGRLLN